VERGEMSELGQQRLAYWRAFREFLDDHRSPLRIERDYAGGNVSFRISQGPFVLVAYRSVHGPGVFVRVQADEPGQVRDALQPLRSEIERISGANLIRADEDTSSQRWLHSAPFSADPADESDWPRQFAWMAETLDRYRAALEYASAELRRDSGSRAA
jgi:hypothetical protein